MPVAQGKKTLRKAEFQVAGFICLKGGNRGINVNLEGWDCLSLKGCSCDSRIMGEL